MNPKSLLFAATGVALLLLLLVLFKPADTSTDAEPAATVIQEVGSASQPPLPAVTVFQWKIVKGQLQDGPATLQARQGDRIELQIVSDHADELHLHGYDLQLQLQADQPAKLEFDALHAGRFELELHHAHREIGVLEILPR